MEKEKNTLENLESTLKKFWKKQGNSQIIAAKHTEFVVEPKVFIGNKLHPEILKLLTLAYLANTSVQDSGSGNIDVTPEKLVIKSPKGRPLVVIHDKKIIEQYLAQ